MRWKKQRFTKLNTHLNSDCILLTPHSTNYSHILVFEEVLTVIVLRVKFESKL